MTDRELDALVAEKVMGLSKGDYYVDYDKLSFQEQNNINRGQGAVIYPLPHYSTSIEAAWQVVEKLKFIEVQILDLGIKRRNFNLCFTSDSNWEASWNNRYGHEVCHAYAETVPRAICLAALKVVGIEI